MLYFHPRRFGWLLVFTLGLWVVTAQAQDFRYHYISFDQVELPSGFTSFFPVAIQNNGRVYGNICDDSSSECYIAFYKDGTITVLPSPVFLGFAIAFNGRGTGGGLVFVGPENGVAQAALFHRGAVGADSTSARRGL